MINYHGQAIVSFSGRAGDLLGIQSRRVEIELEETTPGVFNLTCGLKLEGAEEVRITLPERLLIYGRVAAHRDQIATIISSRTEVSSKRSAQAGG